jgi:hypothetical protein
MMKFSLIHFKHLIKKHENSTIPSCQKKGKLEFSTELKYKRY